jgi:glycerophosphoryl diester phosphodiesterase
MMEAAVYRPLPARPLAGDPDLFKDFAMPLRFAALIVLFLLPAWAAAQDKPAAGRSTPPVHWLDTKTPQGLMDLLHYTGEGLPLVSGHRGGPAAGLPENCLATFENTLQHTFALLEVDPRYTKDGAIVLHHDPRLERTTTGKGLVTDFTLAELKALRLKDADGNPTEYQIPTLDEALEWARGKAVLVLDQKDVPIAARLKKIEEHKAESYAMLIAYSFADAKTCYTANPNVMMEVMVPSLAKVAEFDKLGVPWKNVIAFVGHVPPEDRELYAAIHARGALCMIGTSRNLDRQFIKHEVAGIRELEPAYRAFLARGADLIETDIPAPLGEMLHARTPAPNGKQASFQMK